MLSTVCILLVVSGFTSAAVSLPHYFKPCARNDPNFNECALQHGKDIIPHIVKGERKYKIPPLDPIEITEIKVSEGPRQAGFQLNLHNVKMHGLKDTNLLSENYDFKTQHVVEELSVPKLAILGKYDISGRILVLPISGDGDVNITMVDCKITFTYDFFRDATDHMVIKNTKTVVDPSRAYMHFTNLFNGDKLLGDQMNTFMNENWKDVFKEMSPTMALAFNEVVTTLSNNIASLVPYDTILPEELP